MMDDVRFIVTSEPWMEQANCLGISEDLFFPAAGDNSRQAKAVCAGCVVRPECLDYAMAREEHTYRRYGIWVGSPRKNGNGYTTDNPSAPAGCAPVAGSCLSCRKPTAGPQPAALAVDANDGSHDSAC